MGICKICNKDKNRKIDKSIEKETEGMYDFLSDLADEEGPSVLDDMEMKFICGDICNECFCKYKKSKE